MAKLQTIKKERKARAASNTIEANEVDRSFNRYVRKFINKKDRDRLFVAYRFAKEIKYDHPGISGVAYLAHAVRVACLTMQFAPAVDPDTLVIALLHNILEVSSLKFEDIQKYFNSRIAKAIKLLTVNRSIQNDPTYKALYYKRINTSFYGVKVVKVFDKLDNLFLLCTNPDDNARESYLKEIERYVIPIVERDLKNLAFYYKKLVKNCRKVGYININKI